MKKIVNNLFGTKKPTEQQQQQLPNDYYEASPEYTANNIVTNNSADINKEAVSSRNSLSKAKASSTSSVNKRMPSEQTYWQSFSNSSVPSAASTRSMTENRDDDADEFHAPKGVPNSSNNYSWKSKIAKPSNTQTSTASKNTKLASPTKEVVEKSPQKRDMQNKNISSTKKLSSPQHSLEDPLEQVTKVRRPSANAEYYPMDSHLPKNDIEDALGVQYTQTKPGLKSALSDKKMVSKMPSKSSSKADIWGEVLANRPYINTKTLSQEELIPTNDVEESLGVMFRKDSLTPRNQEKEKVYSSLFEEQTSFNKLTPNNSFSKVNDNRSSRSSSPSNTNPNLKPLTMKSMKKLQDLHTIIKDDLESLESISQASRADRRYSLDEFDTITNTNDTNTLSDVEDYDEQQVTSKVKKQPLLDAEYDEVKTLKPVNYKKPIGLSDHFIIDKSEIRLSEMPIGEGYYGVVYKGRWNEMSIAAKKIKHETNNENMMQEANSLSKLRHPNIVTFYGITEYPNQFIISELMQCSLYQFIHKYGYPEGDRKPKFSNIIVSRILRDIANGGHYLHTRKMPIIHRDLTSSNILLTIPLSCSLEKIIELCLKEDTAIAKLTDFGLSRDVERYMTACVGNLLYASPEVFSGEKYTEVADIYSYGIVMWEIISRKIPYAELTPQRAAFLAFQKKLRPPYDDDELSMRYKDLNQRCWDWDPDVRPHFQDILKELKMINNQTESSTQSTLEHQEAPDTSTNNSNNSKNSAETYYSSFSRSSSPTLHPSWSEQCKNLTTLLSKRLTREALIARRLLLYPRAEYAWRGINAQMVQMLEGDA